MQYMCINKTLPQFANITPYELKIFSLWLKCIKSLKKVNKVTKYYMFSIQQTSFQIWLTFFGSKHLMTMICSMHPVYILILK